MIRRLCGTLVRVDESSAVVQVGGVGYEALVPAGAIGELRERLGAEVLLHTLQYLEGNLAAGSLVPRLVGFLREDEREFFEAFTRVKGISVRRALRAMSLPVERLAAAIENADESLLTSLPEVGRKTAAQIVADLRGKLARFASSGADGGVAPRGAAPLGAAERVALEILVQWGDRRADAERWVAAAVAEDRSLREPDAIVRAAYRLKAAAR